MFYVFYKHCFFLFLKACIDSGKFVEIYFQNQIHAYKIMYSFELEKEKTTKTKNTIRSSERKLGISN